MSFSPLPFNSYCLCGSVDTSDTVQWASKLRYQYNSTTGGDYSGYQALGKPDAFPPGNLNPNAFRLKENKMFGSLIVGFKQPQEITQILIVENHLPGRINKIKLFDDHGGTYIAYQNEPEMIRDFFRTLVVNLPRTHYKVAAIEINLNTIFAPGFSQIDAVGIMDTDDPDGIEELFSGANFNVTPVLSFSSQKMQMETTNEALFKKEYGWAIPQYLPVNGFTINREIGDYVISSDHSVLLMAIENADGYGNLDLYVSKKSGTGYFDQPVNLGATINTAFADFSPYLAPDMKTLYFASEGHSGYGASDIFVSRRQDETWTAWSKPENLGNAVNSQFSESYFSLDPGDGHAYFLSDPGGDHNNIFRIRTIPDKESLEPQPLMALYGMVSSTAGAKPAGSKIILHDTEHNRMYYTYSDPADGHYYVMIPRRREYKVEIATEGFFMYTNHIEISSDSDEFMKNFQLESMEKGKVIPLSSLYFEKGTSKVLKESYPFLEDLLYFLWDNPNLKMELMGHTDNQGSVKSSLKLSEERAYRIRGFLIDNKINPQRVKAKGYGQTMPIAPNDTEENRMKNRRVEVKILDY